jgi:hypothetical protein
MEKDEYYREACEDAREMAHHGHHWTDEVVETRAAELRHNAMITALGNIKTIERPPAAYRYE